MNPLDTAASTSAVVASAPSLFLEDFLEAGASIAFGLGASSALREPPISFGVSTISAS
jgi:hypothetical protein